MAAASEEGFELDPARVKKLVESGDAQLVDVRRPEEVEAGRIPGGVHIEMTEVGTRSSEIDQGRPVVFYCRVGARSALVTEAFRHSGFDAYSMAGGILAWAEAGLPLEPEGGEVAPD
jgi:rhodanese-related sulfurtransferase